jgi:hypothetical protein
VSRWIKISGAAAGTGSNGGGGGGGSTAIISQWTLSSSTTNIVVSAPSSAGLLLYVVITQGSGGGQITWGSSFAADPVPPVNINPDPGSITIVGFLAIGSLWYYISIAP